MVKINIDVVVLASENRGVVAAICWSAIGKYMGSSVLACPGISGPATLEALAFREDLALAADLQVQNCTIVADCLEVVKAIDSKCRFSYCTIILEINYHRKDLPGV